MMLILGSGWRGFQNPNPAHQPSAGRDTNLSGSVIAPQSVVPNSNFCDHYGKRVALRNL